MKQLPNWHGLLINQVISRATKMQNIYNKEEKIYLVWSFTNWLWIKLEVYKTPRSHLWKKRLLYKKKKREAVQYFDKSMKCFILYF